MFYRHYLSDGTTQIYNSGEEEHSPENEALATEQCQLGTNVTVETVQLMDDPNIPRTHYWNVDENIWIDNTVTF